MIILLLKKFLLFQINSKMGSKCVNKNINIILIISIYRVEYQVQED